MAEGAGFGFYLAKAAGAFLAPGSILVCLLLLATVLLLIGRRRAGSVLVMLVMALVVVIALTPLPAWLLWTLEQRIPGPDPMPGRVDGIVVLGGTVNPVLSRDHGTVALNDAAERLTVFISLARRYPDARLVFTGGTGAVFDTGPREADHARQLLADLGFEADRVLWERESRSTIDNARRVADLVAPDSGETWLLVTSAAHMPRSFGVFRAAGWPVVPVPTDYRVARADRWRAAGLLGGLTLVRGAAYEVAALAAYRLAGHTDAVFPAVAPAPAD